MNDTITAVKDDGGDTQAAQEFHERAGDGIDGNGLHHQAKESLIFYAEPLAFVFFHPECLDNARAGNGFLQK